MKSRKLRLLVAAGTVLLLIAGAYAAGVTIGWGPLTGAPEWTAAPTSSPPDPGDRGGAGGGTEFDGGLLGPRPGMVIAPQPIALPIAQPMPLPFGDGPFGSRRYTGGEEVALTFDDGPDPRWTPQVLHALREYEVTATFCVIGELAQAYPELIAEIAADGHTLCNHSWRHDFQLGSRSRDEIWYDLSRTNAAITAAAPGVQVRYYRQPGGFWTAAVVEVAAELGMTSLHWAVDPRDWGQPGAAYISGVVRNQTGPGAIVLLHDGGGDRSGTAEALYSILPDVTTRFTVTALPALDTQPLCLPDCLPPDRSMPMG